MQNNENHPNRRRIRNFFREKGYYIVLGLCVCGRGLRLAVRIQRRIRKEIPAE